MLSPEVKPRKMEFAGVGSTPLGGKRQNRIPTGRGEDVDVDVARPDLDDVFL